MFESFSEWCESLAMSLAYRESLWLFAVTQALHLVAIATFAGAILILDLRMLGLGVVRQPRAALAKNAQRIVLWAGLAVLATGIPQFTANAVSYSRTPMFTFKMWLLLAAVVFTFTLRRKVAGADDGRVPSWALKAVGALSIVLWLAVTASGRLISYF